MTVDPIADPTAYGITSTVALDGGGRPLLTSLPAIIDRLESDMLVFRAEGVLHLSKLVAAVEGEVAEAVGEYLRDTAAIELISTMVRDEQVLLRQRVIMVLGNLSSDAFDSRASETREALRGTDVVKEMLRLIPAVSGVGHVESKLFAAAALQNMCKDAELATEAAEGGLFDLLEPLLRDIRLAAVQKQKKRTKTAPDSAHGGAIQPTADQDELFYHYLAGVVMNAYEAAKDAGLKNKGVGAVLGRLKAKIKRKPQQEGLVLREECARALEWRRNVTEMAGQANEAVGVQVNEMKAIIDKQSLAAKAQIDEIVAATIAEEMARRQMRDGGLFAGDLTPPASAEGRDRPSRPAALLGTAGAGAAAGAAPDAADSVADSNAVVPFTSDDLEDIDEVAPPRPAPVSSDMVVDDLVDDLEESQDLDGPSTLLAPFPVGNGARSGATPAAP